MTTRRLVVNLGIIVFFACIGYVCFVTGKAYSIILENIPITVDGKIYEPMEAVQVRISNQADPSYLLEGDRLIATAVGASHILTIEVLDEDDKVVETRTIPFNVHELKGTPRVLNVAYFYALAQKPQ